jgi:carbonic anhydrase/acetyltransferase-like protein (isoleucine patch superfamily)
VVGSPAKVKRPLVQAELDQLRSLASRYVNYRLDYLQLNSAGEGSDVATPDAPPG